MKSLSQFIKESTTNNLVQVIYRVNIGRESTRYKEECGEIGDIVELSKQLFRKYDNKWMWLYKCNGKLQSGLELSESEFDTKEHCDNYLNSKNETDEFFQYFTDKNKAESISKNTKADYKSKKWTLLLILDGIKSYKPFSKLYRYDFEIKNNKIQTNDPTLYLTVTTDGKIQINEVSRLTFKVSNIPSLYQFFYSYKIDGDGSDKRTHQLKYCKTI